MNLYDAIAAFSFGYPFVMAFYWMTGAILYYALRGRHEPRPDEPPTLASYPPVSIMVPCHNEGEQIDETFAALARIDYPDFEIIAINDGSSDNTRALLDALAKTMPRLRVVHLESNQGKSTALNVGALLARHELLVCIDGDALLEPHAVTWLVRRFQSDPRIGALTGNPRIRNRATLLGRLQVGEFSSIVGLIKRAQEVYGQLFTVSGVICAFRKRALDDAGWWARDALTDDVDVSWRLQLAGWHIAFEPKALCWILMPETLRGLWRQRLRWAEGGTATVAKATPHLWSPPQRWRLIPVWLNYIVSIAWSYSIAFAVLMWLARAALLATEVITPEQWPAFSPIAPVWGTVLGITYLLQAVLSMSLDARFERDMLRSLFWIVWYPMAFWCLQVATAVVGAPRALFRRRPPRGTWSSPDRGVVR